MNGELSAALAALPDDVREPSDRTAFEDALRESVAVRPVPASAARRLWLMSSTAARVAVGYAALGLRRAVSSPEAFEQSAARTQRDAAVRLLAGMAYLRGAAMKVGQAIAQMPELTSDGLAGFLERLCFDAPPMHFALLREQFRTQLGREPGEVFARFDEQAFAAASLGQVHRAETRDGRRVAVKVQYPAIGRAIRADLRLLRTLLLAMRFSPQYANIRRQIDTLTEMLESETDYRREARMLRTAADLFHDEDGVLIPRPLEDLSGERVLTMDFVDGVHVDEYLRRGPSQTERRAAAERIWGGLLRMFYGGRLTYNDPSPGNILFLDDGRVGIVDFGCSHVYDDRDWEIVLDIDRLALRDKAAVPRRAAELLELDLSRPDHRAHAETYACVLDWMYEPMLAEGNFNFAADGYVDRGVALLKLVAARRYFRNCPFAMWSNRMIFGVRALLARLDVAIDTRAAYERETARLDRR